MVTIDPTKPSGTIKPQVSDNPTRPTQNVLCDDPVALCDDPVALCGGQITQVKELKASITSTQPKATIRIRR